MRGGRPQIEGKNFKEYFFFLVSEVLFRFSFELLIATVKSAQIKIIVSFSKNPCGSPWRKGFGWFPQLSRFSYGGWGSEPLGRKWR